MSDRIIRGAQRFPCEICPLRPLETFREFQGSELAFVAKFKKGELAVTRGETVLIEGSTSPHLYTVLIGWGFRYKLLDDGRRQIVNYVMPGDLIGLQGTLMGEMQHSVEALSPMLLCIFEKEELFNLYREHPSLGYDVTWIASREERMLDENMLSLGRRTALERAAYLIAFIHTRAVTVGLNGIKPMEIPLTQQHIADTLGLSLVHTNKTIRKLTDRGLLRWRERGCEVLDLDGLMRLSGWEGMTEGPRPFI